MREARGARAGGGGVRLARAPLSHGREAPSRMPRPAPAPATFFRAIKVVSNISECCLVTFHSRTRGVRNVAMCRATRPRAAALGGP